MSRKSTSTYLENTLGLLVEHFGTGRVRSALAKVSSGTIDPLPTKSRRHPIKPGQQFAPSIASTLEDLRYQDHEKYYLLSNFYTRLKERAILPESLDIRYFAKIIGLKEIAGKSRNDMIPKLMRVLLERPNEQLRRYRRSRERFRPTP